MFLITQNREEFVRETFELTTDGQCIVRIREYVNIEDAFFEIRQPGFGIESFLVYAEKVGYYPEPFQLEAVKGIINNVEFCMCWSRRIGKSLLLAHLSIWFSLWGLRVAYRTAGAKQLEQPREYWADNPFVLDKWADWQVVIDRQMIEATVLSKLNNRSKGMDVIFIDEEAFVDPGKEEEIRNATIMIANSRNPHIIHNSTPRIGSMFQKNYNRLDLIGCTSHASYHDVDPKCAWLNVEFIEGLKETMPLWQFEQEFEAKFVSSAGSVFKNLVESDSTKWPQRVFTPNRIGLDYHGDLGTHLVGTHWDPTTPTILYLVREYNHPLPKPELDEFGNPKKFQKNLMDLTFLRQYVNGYIGSPDGGFDTPWHLLASVYGATAIGKDIASVGTRIGCLRQYNILYDKSLTPDTITDIYQAVWAEDNCLLKTPKTNHWLDAFIAAEPEVNQYNWTPQALGGKIRTPRKLKHW